MRDNCKEDLSIKAFVSEQINVKNALIFILMSVTCSFSYYLINFYVKYLPGNIYTNQIVNSLSESAAHAFSAVVVKLMSIKKGFAFSYLTCGLACMFVMYAEIHQQTWLVPIGVLGAKAGISVAFCFLYFSTVSYFESIFLGFVMGFSNVLGRFSTILAPVVAEKPDPLPMMSCIILCLIAFVSCIMLE
jgi:hypothetical protein